ncbi:MAG: selenocysteine-specific translation elongation factor [Anaerolineales bacterium]|jgi:selenocysteine-specific elongation factor
MRVIGTAGHVDHGKSTLVQALTGINPDRLREEQERQMTIDLGFAWLELPDGEEVGIVDVPGHRDFIENMLAGVGGIDAALLVIAADEGVMPQSREHLAILDLLDIEKGVIALTKVDLIEDPEWLPLVEDEVRGLVKGTSLADAPIVKVSAVTGQGLDALKSALETVLGSSPQRADVGKPRLPIDRVFSISGFGTIITGTLSDGSLEIGDQVEILPEMISGRVRGLQTHKVKLEKAVPGSRAAVNLSGVEVDDLRRGDVLTYPGSYSPTTMIDVAFRLVPDADTPLRHNQMVKLFIGSAQRMARIRLLGADLLKPGEDGWLQLVLEDPIVAARGDHYILRRPSPSSTLGGGMVADAHPTRRHRRHDPEVLNQLEQMLGGTPAEVVLQELKRSGPQTSSELLDALAMDAVPIQEALETLSKKGSAVWLAPENEGTNAHRLIADRGWVTSYEERARSIIAAYHDKWALRVGMPKEELKSRLKLSSRLFGVLVQYLNQTGLLEDQGVFVHLSTHAPELTQKQKDLVDGWLGKFKSNPFSPPSVKDTRQALGDELYQYLLDSHIFVQVSAEVVFLNESYQEMIDTVRQAINQRGAVTVAEVRDLFNTSRKYVLGLLEHLDEVGMTIRKGDTRELRSKK